MTDEQVRLLLAYIDRVIEAHAASSETGPDGCHGWGWAEREEKAKAKAALWLSLTGNPIPRAGSL